MNYITPDCLHELVSSQHLLLINLNEETLQVMKQVIDTRVDIRVLASLHEYFSKSNPNLSRSKLGSLSIELAYELLFSNGMCTPHTEASAQHYLQSNLTTINKLDVTKMVIPESLKETLVVPTESDIAIELKKLEKARKE